MERNKNIEVIEKQEKEVLHIGLDVGSTTVKVVVMNKEEETISSSYTRHFSDTKNTVCTVLSELAEKYKDYEYTVALTGSGAMSIAGFLDVPFIQEVVACKRTVEKYIPKTNVVNACSSILIDDYSGNIKEWQKNLGIGIKFVKEKENGEYPEITHLSEIIDMFV